MYTRHISPISSETLQFTIKVKIFQSGAHPREQAEPDPAKRSKGYIYLFCSYLVNSSIGPGVIDGRPPPPDKY